MYSEQDFTEIRRRLRRAWLDTGIVAAVALAVYILALARGVKWLAYAAGVALFIAACYGLLAKIVPCAKYLRFLTDMKMGGSHEFRGQVVSVSEKEEPQDGVRVLPVTVLLDDPAEERAYYLNVDKAGDFPKPGEPVHMRCFGRHIIQLLDAAA